jgi:hypothetical protein
MRLEDPLRWPFRQPAADRTEATPIHDSLLPVSTPAPCLDFVWGDHVVPLVVPQPAPEPVVGRAQVPVGLLCLVFPAPACDPALLPAS